VTKERRYRRDGAFYIVSPYALTCDAENYYLIAYDGETAGVRHYRVDRMTNIAAVNEARDGAEAFRATDPARYTRKVFGMFSGREERVRLRFARHLVNAVLDRLGQDVSLVPDGEEHFTVSADVQVSPQFFAWLAGFGDEVRVTAPPQVAAGYRAHIERICRLYAEDAGS